MLKLKTLICPLIISVSLTLTTPASAGPDLDAEQGRNPIHHLLAKLDLSQQQKQDIQALLRQSAPDDRLPPADHEASKDPLSVLIYSSEWNEKAVVASLQQQHQQHAAADIKRANTLHQIWTLLTTEQKNTFTELAKATPMERPPGRQGPHDRATPPERPPGGERNVAHGDDADQHFDAQTDAESDCKRRPPTDRPPEVRPPHGFARPFLSEQLIEDLALSAAQQASITAINTQARDQHQAAMAAMSAFENAKRDLIASEEFSTDRYQALQARYQPQLLQQTLLELNIQHQIWNVLSAQQQAQALANTKRYNMTEHKARHTGSGPGRPRGG